LEFSHRVEDGHVQLLVIEDGQLVTQAQLPEERRDWQVDLPVINDCFRDDGTTKSENIIDLLDFLLRELPDAHRFWEQQVVSGQSPHLELRPFIDINLPPFELIGDIIIELKRGSQSSALFALKLELQEAPLVNLGQQLKGARNQLIPSNDDLLLGYLLQGVLLIGRLLATLLLHVLSQEVDGSVHVNR
jgi:hypothetical protein